MNTKILFLGAVCLCFAQTGCAASNGGGHVVGNPIISEGASARMAKDSACDCATSKDAKVKADCKCAGKASTPSVPCKDGSESCTK